MTQREAAQVGCRLIAVYFVFNTLFEVIFFTIGTTITEPQYTDAMKRAGVVGMLRSGVAVLLWVAAPRIARLAAEPEEGEEGWRGGTKSDVR
jgi:hypothetical protein